MESDPITEQKKDGLMVAFLIVSIVAIVLAVAGLGVAIWAAVKDNTRIAKIDGIEERLDSLIKQVEDERTIGVTTVTWEEAEEDEDGVRFIFIEEWGVKFPFPDEMASISFRFHGGRELRVTGRLANSVNTYAYEDVMRCALSTMTRSLNSQERRFGDATFVSGIKAGDFYYYPWHPHHYCVYSSEGSFDSEGLASTIIFHMLQRPRLMHESFFTEGELEDESDTGQDS